MAKRDRKGRRWKQRCCDKPPRRACKACPRRRPGGVPEPRGRSSRRDEETPEPGCPLAAWRLA